MFKTIIHIILMYLSSQTIEQIRAVPASDVVGHYVKLKLKGSNYTGLCPFHDERTPSFSVNDAKGIYKCFGCGRSGDGLKFVQEHENKTFQEACEMIAKIAGIHLEYETRELSEKEKIRLSDAEAQEKVLNYVIPI